MNFKNLFFRQKGGKKAKEYCQKGNNLILKGKIIEGVSYFTKALKSDPTYHKALFLRSTAYSIMREWDSAIKDYSTLLTTNYPKHEIYKGRALAYVSKSNELVERYKSAGGKKFQLSFEELDIPIGDLMNSVSPDKAMWLRTTNELMELHSSAKKDAQNALKYDHNDQTMRELIENLLDKPIRKKHENTTPDNTQYKKFCEY